MNLRMGSRWVRLLYAGREGGERERLQATARSVIDVARSMQRPDRHGWVVFGTVNESWDLG